MTNINDLQLVSSEINKLLPVKTVLQQLQITKHMIIGDGSCLYHAMLVLFLRQAEVIVTRYHLR